MKRKIYYMVVNGPLEMKKDFYKFSTMVKFFRKVGMRNNYPFKFKDGICYSGMVVKTPRSFKVIF